ncbi:MAG: MBL fold metallo-hydrolase [Akkermansiaceae bacterium]|nr:MBL fold metallo-hydrolase [Akkermansiaceae bacterium]MCP5547594.1 MBL fold metallo-hydrolase [Akkermansiaceae bacterium]
MSRRYENPWPHEDHSVLDILWWKLGVRHRETPVWEDAPDTPAEHIALDPAALRSPPTAGWRVLWLGHSSFLLQGAEVSLLIDPVFSPHCAPLPFPSLRRLVDPPCGIRDLPEIDAVLLSHSHYDHCDVPTLEALGNDIPLIVPEGHRSWLAKKGFRDVREAAWFESLSFRKGVTFTATPSQHFTARTPFDRNRAHWCGWLVEGGGCKLWHAGDSAWCPAFREIGERLGPIDLGMIPIGAYQPRSIMRSMHMNPEEAVDVFEDTRCRRAIAMHWGTFRLTDEPMGEPPLRLRNELRKRGIADDVFRVPMVGEMFEVGRRV